MPASDTIASVIVAASSGERWFKPASAEMSSSSSCRITRQMTSERRQHGEQITGQIIQHRRLPAGAQRRHAQQQITGVRDARIAEQPLQVALRKRAEVAVKNRDAGNDDEQVRPMRRARPARR